MATIGQIIFGSMIAIIFILAGIIILILATSLGGNAGSMVESRFKFPVGNLDGDVMLDCKFIAVDSAYSAPKFTIEATGQAATLKAVAQRWYPKPTVSWTDFNGANLTGETEFSNNSAGIFKVTSVLKTVKVDDSYDCIIENALVKSVSNALVTDSGVTEKNYFKMNSAALPLPHWLIFSFHFPLWTYWILS
ncbi:V-set domain-containing T-cell activation inhibitor 1 isoform X2 [Acipenser ruthenus]|uniref:V-set domain-containing T-cell activation inhibitor 1 isoform X2 n=1 Tax=Acipenser ruthenus TaxID=7906 RepID=UPI00145B82A8|nr:V-set domain-containing T-cell activation inhibitor 1 isoform X2 [Acipenser ruthenus]